MSTRAGEGIDDGWRCLEIVEGCRLTRLAGSSVVEARSCDVTVEPLPFAEFDLVHARLVLELLPEHDLVLRKLVRAVRLGGWLLVEDLDWTTSTAPPAAADAHRRVADAILGVLGGRGYDPRLGRRLPGLLRREGLADVTALARPLAAAADGGRTEPAWELLVDRWAPALVGRRLLDRDDVDTLLQLGLHGIHECLTPVLVSAWGRRGPHPHAREPDGHAVGRPG